MTRRARVRHGSRTDRDGRLWVTRARGESRAGDYGETVGTDTSHPTGIGRGLVLLLALTCGAAVANLYYAQPLLHTLARDFDVSNAAAGLLVTVSQLGYVIGLALLVPVGDLRERRGLITVTLAITAGGLGDRCRCPGVRRVRRGARCRRRHVDGRAGDRADGVFAGG